MAGFHDPQNTLEFRPGFAPVVLTNSDAAQTTAIVDLKGYENVTWVIQTGTLTDTNATFAVSVAHGDAVDSESAPTAITDTGAAPAETLDPQAAAASFTFADDGVVRSICYTPGRGAGKRYARLTVTPSGNNDGAAPLACIAVLKPYSFGA